MQDIFLDLRQQLITRAFKFDEHFRNLLSSSKVSLHNMFADAYGTMYEKNTIIFTAMFENLEQYYAHGQINLTRSMKKFFDDLYKKIFQLAATNKIYTSQYLDCASNQLANTGTFKDIPEKLIEEIRHAFVAARTFHQALQTGIDVVKMIISVSSASHILKDYNQVQ